MHSLYLPCAVCGSYDAERLFPSFNKERETPTMEIAICRHCGLVYRTPVIPEICEPAYQQSKSWLSGFPDHFATRFDLVANAIANTVKLDSSDRFLDIGAGPGWFAERLHARFPKAQPVLLEPALDVSSYSKSTNPRAVTLPSMLGETTLESNSFKLVLACGVDYLFQDHRGDMERIRDLLVDDGVFYLERNVFVGARSLYAQPMFDMDDIFGANHLMNTWFSPTQLEAYLATFFTVFDRITYAFDLPEAQFGQSCIMQGYFCRKTSSPKPQWAEHGSIFEENLTGLKMRAEESSLADLRDLRASGIRCVSVAGVGDEAQTLTRLIAEHDLFELAGVIDPASFEAGPPPWSMPKATPSNSNPEAVLVASVEHQQRIYKALALKMPSQQKLNCFRPGTARFRASEIQMKAFLPALLSGRRARHTSNVTG